MIFLGCDPGIGGAVASWRPDDDTLVVIDTPTLLAGAKRSVDAYQLAQIFDLQLAPALCVIEQVAARPGAGVSGMFNFGRSTGILEGLICAQFWPLESVMPHVWKRRMNCPKAKDGARARASALLPKHAHNWPLKKHDGRAEAALLALYAELVFKQRELGK